MSDKDKQTNLFGEPEPDDGDDEYDHLNPNGKRKYKGKGSHEYHRMHEHSMESYNDPEVQVELSHREAMIVGVLKGKGQAMTDREINEALGFVDMNSVRPSITHMTCSGVLVECGHKRCHVTGRKVRKVTLGRKKYTVKRYA